jgi:transcriptional regulator
MTREASAGPLLRGTLDLLLLQALAGGPRHGYAIARAIEAATGDVLAVEEGSLYPALHRLEAQGAVTGRWGMAESGRRVRVYALTRAGRARLAEKKQSWAAFARAVSRMVGGA